MPPPRTLPARLYAAPEYRAGYAAGCRAARARQADENPYLLQDLRHVGWADACYDQWSARRVEFERAAGRRAESHSQAPASAVASRP
ncbi:MAG TPA: hypothetical protein VLW52_06000 [Opitutaceae bacterium]|nr:hypothetical protein [Opitutaceae bacterium]